MCFALKGARYLQRSNEYETVTSVQAFPVCARGLFDHIFATVFFESSDFDRRMKQIFSSFRFGLFTVNHRLIGGNLFSSRFCFLLLFSGFLDELYSI